jgi:hypothetical protein
VVHPELRAEGNDAHCLVYRLQELAIHNQVADHTADDPDIRSRGVEVVNPRYPLDVEVTAPIEDPGPSRNKTSTKIRVLGELSDEFMLEADERRPSTL